MRALLINYCHDLQSSEMYHVARSSGIQRISTTSSAVFAGLCCLSILTGCGSTSSFAPPTDTIPPSIPMSFAAVAASSTQINLSWAASTDNVGVTGYRVERCQGAGCTTFAQIATPTATTFNDAGLTASTSYSYRVRATDAAGNLSAYSNTSGATTEASTVSVTISPRRGSLTISQTQQFTAAVTGTANIVVSWEVDAIPGGSAGVGTISATGLYTPPAAAASHTITARSVADNTQTASAFFGVTDLAGIFTQRYDLQRTGQNQKEYALTSSTVGSSTFGKLFSCLVDGEAYAQPLYVANLAIGGGTHNTIFVATENDSVYAFDADTSPCVQRWTVSLLSGGTPVSPADTGETGDINNKIGITGTPVIDPASKTLYVVSKTKEGSVYHQRLHALSLTDGSEKFNGPADITNALTVPGNGDTGNGLLH
jgi:chitodextrinase